MSMYHPAVESLSVESDFEGGKTEVPSIDGQSDPDTSATSVMDEVPDDEDYDDEDYELIAKPFWDFITNRVSAFEKDAPKDPADFAAFKCFWRESLDLMRAELVGSEENELFITNPPISTLEIEILDDRPEHECPCCLPDAEANTVIRAEGGITRDVFLRAVRDHLYRDNVVRQELGLGDVYDGRLVIRGWDYMMTGTALYRGSSYNNMRIWMYCSGM